MQNRFPTALATFETDLQSTPSSTGFLEPRHNNVRMCVAPNNLPLPLQHLTWCSHRAFPNEDLSMLMWMMPPVPSFSAAFACEHKQQQMRSSTCTDAGLSTCRCAERVKLLLDMIYHVEDLIAWVSEWSEQHPQGWSQWRHAYGSVPPGFTGGSNYVVAPFNWNSRLAGAPRAPKTLLPMAGERTGMGHLSHFHGPNHGQDSTMPSTRQTQPV